jgi:hypothetical protein
LCSNWELMFELMGICFESLSTVLILSLMKRQVLNDCCWKSLGLVLDISSMILIGRYLNSFLESVWRLKRVPFFIMGRTRVRKYPKLPPTPVRVRLARRCHTANAPTGSVHGVTVTVGDDQQLDAAERCLVGEIREIFTPVVVESLLKEILAVDVWRRKDGNIFFGAKWVTSDALADTKWRARFQDTFHRALWAHPRVKKLFPTFESLCQSTVRFHVNYMDSEGRHFIWHADGKVRDNLLTAVTSFYIGCPPEEVGSAGGAVLLSTKVNGAVRTRANGAANPRMPGRDKPDVARYQARHNACYLVHGSKQQHAVERVTMEKVIRLSVVQFFELPEFVEHEGQDHETHYWMALMRGAQMRGWQVGCSECPKGYVTERRLRNHYQVAHQKLLGELGCAGVRARFLDLSQGWGCAFRVQG